MSRVGLWFAERLSTFNSSWFHFMISSGFGPQLAVGMESNKRSFVQLGGVGKRLKAAREAMSPTAVEPQAGSVG